MSGAIGSGNLGNYGLLGQLIADNATVHTQLDTLTTQASSGLVSNTYAGLGNAASIALDLNPQITRLQTWQSNIDTATGRMGVTQTALTRLQSIASTWVANTNNLNGLNPPEVDTLAAQARTALQEVAGLLNTQDGSVYVFAGQDSANPPVPNPDQITTSPFFTQVQSAVQQLSTLGASGTAASTLATAQSNDPATSPFSSYMSQSAANLAAPTIQIGINQTVVIGLFASSNEFVQSQGSSTTLSYTRDLMRALATIGSLTSTQVNDPNFAGLIGDTRTSLTNAVTAMASEAGVLGNTQANLTATQARLSETQTALTTQVGTAQDVDMAKTLSKLSAVQTQLQASYQIIASVNGLSLVKFLPAA
jgi:flagellar hook-associated protein 3 FlgL